MDSLSFLDGKLFERSLEKDAVGHSKGKGEFEAVGFDCEYCEGARLPFAVLDHFICISAVAALYDRLSRSAIKTITVIHLDRFVTFTGRFQVTHGHVPSSNGSDKN